MQTFRFFWTTHKWVGVSVALLLVTSAVTGFLLLLKKDYAWLQPPTQVGAPGDLDRFLTLAQAWERVVAHGHPAFRTPADIERIDVRPADRIYKVRSRRDFAEIQVDAVAGTVLSVATRRSDWLETIHDGSWLGGAFHGYVMPLVALCVVFLAFSGCRLWLEPILRRRRHRRHGRARG